MFEALLTLLMVLGILYIDVLWIKVIIVVLYFSLILTGIYSMIWGAPFVAIHKKRLLAIVDLGNFKKDDYVVELGAGEGRVVRAIADTGVNRVVGYEFSVLTYFFARVIHYFKNGKGRIVFGNFWKQDYSDVDVVVCFLLDRAVHDVENLIWPKLKKGSRLISNAFKMKNIEPTDVKNGVYLYVKQ